MDANFTFDPHCSEAAAEMGPPTGKFAVAVAAAAGSHFGQKTKGRAVGSEQMCCSMFQMKTQVGCW